MNSKHLLWSELCINGRHKCQFDTDRDECYGIVPPDRVNNCKTAKDRGFFLLLLTPTTAWSFINSLTAVCKPSLKQHSINIDSAALSKLGGLHLKILDCLESLLISTDERTKRKDIWKNKDTCL